MSRRSSGAGAITCRHLLVPVDETDGSTATVIGSIELARIADARITFIHVPRILAATAVDSPLSFSGAPHDHASRSRELLVKAESIAQALGVPCASAGSAGRPPHVAILTAAHEAGCDLIFIGVPSHDGNPGTRPGPLVLSVLAHSDIPVLLLPVPKPAAPARAVRIIRDEHRALSAILRAWLDMLMAAKDQGRAADVPLMRAVIQHLGTLPIAQHPPHEEALLFVRLRRRTAKVDAELDELEHRHLCHARLAGMLAEAVERYRTGAPLIDLIQTVDRYARSIWEHMGREEGVIFPAAERCLTEDDWVEIDAGFGSGTTEARTGGTRHHELEVLLARATALMAHSGGPHCDKQLERGSDTP